MFHDRDSKVWLFHDIYKDSEVWLCFMTTIGTVRSGCVS